MNIKILIALLISILLMQCQSSIKVDAPKSYKSHSKEAWLLRSSEQNKTSLKEQTKKDNELGQKKVPHELKQDANLMIESAAIWRDVCSRCHGMDGKSKQMTESSVKSRDFGTMGMQMGFLFGRDKMRAGLFKKISKGTTSKEGREAMPSFQKKLSKQQIWAVIFYIESL